MEVIFIYSFTLFIINSNKLFYKIELYAIFIVHSKDGVPNFIANLNYVFRGSQI